VLKPDQKTASEKEQEKWKESGEWLLRFYIAGLSENKAKSSTIFSY